MMRYLSLEQQDLYHQYSQFGKQLADIEITSKEKNNNTWKLIAIEGIWRLSIARKFGGKGLTWQEPIIALDAIFTNYPNIELLYLLLSQIKVIYLISQYGTDIVKRHYLPRLMKGEMGTLSVSDNVDYLSHPNSWLKKNIKQISCINKNKICINIIKNKNDIVFCIFDKKPTFIFSGLKKLIMSTGNKFTFKEKGVSILFDFINFERLLYGILSASLVQRMNIKKASNQC